VIEETQVVFHKADEPDFIAYLLDADVSAGEDGAEIYLAAADADAATLGDGDGTMLILMTFSRVIESPFFPD
jgi:hypothetical protein